MIIKMINKYEKELSDFLYEHNLLKEYFLAWIPTTYKEISSLVKDNFILCIENYRIVGCIGAYISYEQKVARLLGPIIDKEYFERYADILYEQCLQNMPKDIVELKIAFFEENTLCKHWCERIGFDLYNAETTMVYNRGLFKKQETQPSVILKFYEPKYKKGLEQVHPKGVFFTLDELVNQISSYHHLLLAIVQDEVLGYVYYEQAEDNKQGEIQLLHIRDDKRGKGYGTLLLNRAIENLINDSVEQILINVRVTNYAAQKLYKRIGFEDEETIYAYKKLLHDSNLSGIS